METMPDGDLQEVGWRGGIRYEKIFFEAAFTGFIWSAVVM